MASNIFACIFFPFVSSNSKIDTVKYNSKTCMHNTIKDPTEYADAISVGADTGRIISTVTIIPINGIGIFGVVSSCSWAVNANTDAFAFHMPQY